MLQTVAMRMALSAALVGTLSVATAAQPEQPTLEGTWHLVSYAAGDALAQVPWNVDATLLLQDGQATGSAGCHYFRATYEIVADTLTFGDPTATAADCTDPSMDVEAGYMAGLPRIGEVGR